jgi:predicted ribosome quality control (RQC) complex YloA/Tae2 family protein
VHNNYHFLKHLASELKEILLGAQLLTCFSQEKDELLVGFEANGIENFLKCTLKPEFSCITLLKEFARAKRNTVNIWEDIYDNRVLDIAVFENERALKITLENHYTLVIKLFGNRPNLLLFHKEKLVSIFNNSLISDRELLLSDFEKTMDLSFENFLRHEGNYRKVFFTFGKNAFHYLDSSILNLGLEEKWSYIQNFIEKMQTPNFFVGRYNELPSLTLFEHQNTEKHFESANEAINFFYSYHQKEFSFANAKASTLHQLEKEKQKTESYLANTESKLVAMKNGHSKEHLANILMANLHVIEDGQSEVELFNFYTESNINIKLKKDISPQKNAENYYRKSKNERLELESIEKNIEKAYSKIVELELQIENIKGCDSFKELKSILKTNTKKIDENIPDKKLFKEYLIDGTLILVGKNSKNNDLLTLKHAQKEDYWLHARDCPGSHVIIKRTSKETMPNHVIEFAASLAAYYSKRKNEQVVPVIFTQKKYVRKTKGLPDGQVIVDKESTIMIEPYRP